MGNNDEERKTPLMGYFTDDEIKQIEDYAEKEKRSISNTLAFLAMKGLKEENKKK